MRVVGVALVVLVVLVKGHRAAVNTRAAVKAHPVKSLGPLWVVLALIVLGIMHGGPS